MTQEEFDKVKVGDTLYYVDFPTDGIYYKGTVYKKLNSVAKIEAENGFTYIAYVEESFTTEEEAKAYIVKQVGNYIESTLHDICRKFKLIYNLNKDALDENLIVHAENLLRTAYNKLKGK